MLGAIGGAGGVVPAELKDPTNDTAGIFGGIGALVLVLAELLPNRKLGFGDIVLCPNVLDAVLGCALTSTAVARKLSDSNIADANRAILLDFDFKLRLEFPTYFLL